MALNQSIFSPLTLYSGSISSYTSDTTNALQIISSSLPIYQNTNWEYKIMTLPSSSIVTTQTPVNDLRLTLQNSKKYIVEGYLSGANTSATVGLRVGVITTAAQTHYVIQNPTSATAILYSFSVTNVVGSGAGNNINNYFLVYIKGIIITDAAGSPTWTPTISTETAGTAVAIGPSVIYYRHY